jgi:hypothetical protein
MQAFHSTVGNEVVGTTAKPSSATIFLPIVIIVRWTISFGFIEHDQATGGWVSATETSVTANFTAWAWEASYKELHVIPQLV